MVDVFPGPCGGRHLIGNGRIFSGESKGVPAHGLQHVFALHPLVARDHVGDGVVAHVAHVEFAAGVGKHGQAVKLFPRLIGLYGETTGLGPLGLQRQFQGLRCVFLTHCSSITAAGDVGFTLMARYVRQGPTRPRRVYQY